LDMGVKFATHLASNSQYGFCGIMVATREGRRKN
jgi:hypothetical protein